MCEENVIVDRKGYIFLGGPPLVQAATGAVVSAEELGGAIVHCSQSGVSDYFAANDQHAIELARKIIRNSNYKHNKKLVDLFSKSAVKTSDFNFDGTQRICARKLIEALADENEFDEFKKMYGNDIVTGFCNVSKIHCGVISNNGVLSVEGALKATSFVQICSKRKIPLIFIQNALGLSCLQTFM